MTTPSSPAPPLTGQDINVAARATRQALIAGLAPLGVGFEEWVVVNLVGSGQVTDEAAMRARLTAGLGSSAAELDELLESSDLVARTDGGGLALTAAGRETFAAGTKISDALVAELYAGFEPDELATTRRVLVELTERAQSSVTR